MHPDLFTLNLPVLGEITITSFGAFMALAFLSGYWVLRIGLENEDADPNLASDVLIGALIGGIVGAKIYYALLYWERTAIDPFGMLFSRAGLVWYGGLIGGVIGAVIMLRRQKVSIAWASDLVAPALALAYAVGRIGCLMVGDDYGRPTDSWVGMEFPDGLPPSTAGNIRRLGIEVDPAIADTQVLAVHPTQIYETLMSFGIFLVLWRLRFHPRKDGWLFALWLALAGVERFVVEFFRAKDDRFFGPLTLAQVISLGLVVLGVYVMRRRAAGPPALAT